MNVVIKLGHMNVAQYPSSLDRAFRLDQLRVSNPKLARKWEIVAAKRPRNTDYSRPLPPWPTEEEAEQATGWEGQWLVPYDAEVIIMEESPHYYHPTGRQGTIRFISCRPAKDFPFAEPVEICAGRKLLPRYLPNFVNIPPTPAPEKLTPGVGSWDQCKRRVIFCTETEEITGDVSLEGYVYRWRNSKGEEIPPAEIEKSDFDDGVFHFVINNLGSSHWVETRDPLVELLRELHKRHVLDVKPVVKLIN